MSRKIGFDVYQDAAGEWRWRLRSKNGRVVADCAEGYKTRAGITRAVSVVENLIIGLRDEKSVPDSPPAGGDTPPVGVSGDLGLVDLEWWPRRPKIREDKGLFRKRRKR